MICVFVHLHVAVFSDHLLKPSSLGWLIVLIHANKPCHIWRQSQPAPSPVLQLHPVRYQTLEKQKEDKMSVSNNQANGKRLGSKKASFSIHRESSCSYQRVIPASLDTWQVVNDARLKNTKQPLQTTSCWSSEVMKLLQLLSNASD